MSSLSFWYWCVGQRYNIAILHLRSMYGTYLFAIVRDLWDNQNYWSHCEIGLKWISDEVGSLKSEKEKLSSSCESCKQRTQSDQVINGTKRYSFVIAIYETRYIFCLPMTIDTRSVWFRFVSEQCSNSPLKILNWVRMFEFSIAHQCQCSTILGSQIINPFNVNPEYTRHVCMSSYGLYF